ncbi:MAG: hypothetical protein IJ802_00985 [Kiritimatiellae bacterium]|nr:hypothetical protein [Kiritimatiellia bacterium]
MLEAIGVMYNGVWGPLRLLGSYAVLMSIGALGAGLLVQRALPRLWDSLPRDRGKEILGKEGLDSKNKPTGAGNVIVSIALIVMAFVVPWTWDVAGAVACLFFAMKCGYWDDAAPQPWGRVKKGILDAVASIGVAAFLYFGMTYGTGDLRHVAVWLPFHKQIIMVPWAVYIPLGAFFLWFVMNATNCSDGVDSLTGTLSVISLVCFAAVLYLVIGNTRIAHYFLIDVGGTMSRNAARWAVVTMTSAGAFAGYLWWNAYPSNVLMGDAGSRYLGLLAGAAALATGNPLLILVFMAVPMVNGGTGLGKIVLLKFLHKAGVDTAEGSSNIFVRILNAVRCPLHDHCGKKWGWSKPQIFLRFTLLQLFLIPLLFVIFVKIR